MIQCNEVIGIGSNAEEALLYARVNQCCSDKGVKANTIAKKTDFIEISNNIEIDGYKNPSKIITAIHFAAAYYTYQQNAINSKANAIREFTNSEYKYYSILIREMGSKKFNEIMKCYHNTAPNTCLAINIEPNIYKFLY